MKNKINLLFIGDIIGEPGLNIVKSLLQNFISKYKIDFVIANAENISDGMGLLEKDAKRLLELPIDVLSGGNHTMDKIQSHKYISETKNILRPNNYPKGAYGHGFGVFPVNGTSHKVCVINLQGRTYMKPIDCPFRNFDWTYDKVKEESKIIIVDFHAETTAEKIAFGWYSDGKASAVFGTHTHIQTSDERILPQGTAYISDVGMTGPYDSVIGMKKESSIKRFVYGTPQKHEVAENDLRFAAVVCEIDAETGKSNSIKRIFYPEF
ncbi:MAG: TIGR00282 family metallophosphoesterase [Ignavibacteriae bacterium]|nr:TIGR00282 family metallophosphoesterase [Ignavibacteriota bacterium]